MTFLVLVALGVGWLRSARQQADAEFGGTANPRDPATVELFEVVPRDAMMVVDVDLVRFRASRLGQLLIDSKDEVPAIGEVEKRCGTDPMDLVDRVVVVVPTDATVGFGVFAAGQRIQTDAWTRCARAMIAGRGGALREEKRDGFTLISDTSPGGAVLAVRSGGPLIVAERPYLQRALDTFAKRQPSIINTRHLSLLRPFGKASVRVSVLPTDAQRRMFVAEVRRQDATASPFVSVIGAAASLSDTDPMRILGTLECDDATKCKQAGKLFERVLEDEQQNPVYQLTGLSAVMRATRVSSVAKEVRLNLSLGADDAMSLVRRLLLVQRELTTAPSKRAPDPSPSGSPSTAPSGSAGPPPGSASSATRPN